MSSRGRSNGRGYDAVDVPLDAFHAASEDARLPNLRLCATIVVTRDSARSAVLRSEFEMKELEECMMNIGRCRCTVSRQPSKATKLKGKHFEG